MEQVPIPGETIWRDLTGSLGVLPALMLVVVLSLIAVYITKLIRNGGRSPSPESSRTDIEHQLTILSTVEQLATQMTNLEVALNSLAIALEVINTEIKRLPTREDLAEAANNTSQTALTLIREMIDSGIKRGVKAVRGVKRK